MKIDVNSVIEIFKKEYPHATCALKHKNPYQLLIATILSAQCTDKRVNQVTPLVFEKYSDVEKMAQASKADLERLIKSTGFYKNKAKNIIECCKKIVESYNGRIPDNMEELIKLPGVGRKTANVVLANAFMKNQGIVVDTHVKRLAYRLGFTTNKNPEKIEKDLMMIVPQKEWGNFSNLLILHGRKYCKSRNPSCNICPIAELCPKIGVK